MKKNIIVNAVFFAFILVLAGCATIIKGTREEIQIGSDPSNANVVVQTTDGFEVYSGTTPTKIILPKKNEYLVTVSIKGYESTTIKISHTFEPWAIAGVVGILIDAIDGAMWNLEPNQIMITLKTSALDNVSSQAYAWLQVCDEGGAIRSLLVPLRPSPL